MNSNGVNPQFQFQSRIPPEEQGHFRSSLSQFALPLSSQMQYQSASPYWQGTPRQTWAPQDTLMPYGLPRIPQEGMPRWAQPTHPHIDPRQQQDLRPTGDIRQCLQQPSLPQHVMQGYHPQPMQEYYPQQFVQQHPAQLAVQEGLSQQSVQELAGAVAMQLGYTRNVESVSARVIAQCANNDKIVVDALKWGKAKGLNALGAIEKLGNANGYPNSLWKNYALARLDKISPRAYSSCTAARSKNRGGPRKRPSQGGPIPPPRSQPAASSSNCTGLGIDNNDNLNCSMHRRIGRDNQAYQPSYSLSEHDGPHTNVQIRSRRSGPIPEYHAGTLIPPLAPSSRPEPPVRDPGHDHESRKFTDEDKIFFIHFLKWYLGQERGTRIPDRDDLYHLLARQTPQHNAEEWRRHWDRAPELPDKIYIEARKRADEAALARSVSLSPSSDEDESEDGSDVEDDELLEEPTSPVLNQVQHASPTQRRPRKAARCVKVVEQDLRDMARYKYERRDEWSQFPNLRAQWKDFAESPQNCKRSLEGWYYVNRVYHEEIDRYCKEYADGVYDEGSELDAESELEYLDVATPGQRDTGSPSGSSSTSSGPSTQTSDEASTLPGSGRVSVKRERTDSESETACSLGNAEEDLPAAKRVKEEEEEDEKPELSILYSD